MLGQPLGDRHGPDWFAAAGGAVMTAVMLFTLVRLGLLATLVLSVAAICTWAFPFTTDFSRWYASIGLTGLLAFAALAGYGFWIALAGQPLLKDELRS
jgi:hypothetical protein